MRAPSCLLAGCSVFDGNDCVQWSYDPGNGSASSYGKAGSAHSSGVAAWTLEEHLLQIAKRDVPGFGGYYFDGPNSTGNLNIFLIEPNDGAAQLASKRLASIHGPAILGVPVRPVQGQYDFIQLYDYRVTMRDGIDDWTGVSSFGIREDKNRVGIGVIRGKGASDTTMRIRTWLTQLGIPQEAVLIEEEDAPQKLAGAC